MSTVLRGLLITIAASSSASCGAASLAPPSACDGAAALVAEQYDSHRMESDEKLMHNTGRPRLYYQVVLEPQFTEKQLRALRDDPRTSEFVMASLSLAGDAEKLSKLIKSGIGANSTSDDGVPILVIAAQCKRVDVVNVLVDLGANVYAHDRQNIDAMAAAILEDSDSIVTALVDHGYRVDPRTKSGQVTSKLALSLHNGKYDKLLRVKVDRSRPDR